MTIAAVDIGGTKIAVGMVDEHGQVLCKTESPTNTADYANGLNSIAAMLRQTAQQARQEQRHEQDHPCREQAGQWRSRAPAFIHEGL